MPDGTAALDLDLGIPDRTPARLSERDMLNLVHRRFSHSFNGLSPRYIVAEHVRFDPTWGGRTLDVIVCDTWPSDGYAMHGIEIKCSRSDLKRELDDMTKSRRFTDHLDYFWLAVSDDTVLRGLEVPSEWGVLVVSPTGQLRSRRAAPRLRDKPTHWGQERESMPRTVQVAMLRATRKTYEKYTKENAR